MNPSFAMHARLPWAVIPENLNDFLAIKSGSRPRRKPMYRQTEDGSDMEEDWSRAEQHNQARLMIQSVGGSTAYIQVRGMILKQAEFYDWYEGYATSLTLLDLALDMVAEGGYLNLILDFNSPGGSVLGLMETANRIKTLQSQGINTIAYTSLMCASAAYYLASACKEIFASPTAVVGSIGTYSVFMDFSAAAEMEGLKFEVFVARDAPYKAAGENGSLTDPQKEEMQRHVDEADAMFQAQVKGSRRSLDLEAASTGAWWYARSSPFSLVDNASLFHSLDDLLAVVAGTSMA